MQIIRLPVVRERTGLSRSTIYALAARGDFPTPIKLGARASGWVADEISSWLERRVAESRGRSE